MWVKINTVCCLIYLYICAYVQDEAGSALYPHVTVPPWSVLKYFINKMDPVYSRFCVHYRVNRGSIEPEVQKGHENVNYGLSILYHTA